jgi:hypothetical protein
MINLSRQMKQMKPICDELTGNNWMALGLEHI